MKQERICETCSYFDPDMFEENREEVAGYCTKVSRCKLKYQSDTCKEHRFKRGTKE